MKAINTSNVSVLAIKVIVDLKKGTIVADLSPTVWIGTGYNNVTATITIKDRSGIVLTTQTLAHPETDQVGTELPKMDGIVKWGSYTGEVALTDNGAIYKDTNTRNVSPPCEDHTQNNGNIAISISPKCSLSKTLVVASVPPPYQGENVTSYLENVKYYYPNGSDTGDLSGTFTPFYAKLVEGRNEATIETIATYEFENYFTIIVPYTGNAVKNVVCISDLCNAYIALDLLYQRLETKCDKQEQEQIVQTIDIAVEYMVMIEHGTICGYDVGDYIERLEKLLNIDMRCSNIPPMELPSIPADTLFIEGCNVEETQIGFTRRFKINNYTYIIKITNTDGTISQIDEATACERITKLSFNWDKVTDIALAFFAGSKNQAFFNIINTKLSTEVDPKCVASAMDWRNADYAKKMQMLIDKMCDCCNQGTAPGTPLMTLQLDCATALVTENFIAGATGSGTIKIPIQVTGAGSISGEITGSGFSGVLGATDVTAASQNITIPITYNGSGSGGARNATVTVLYPGNRTVTCVIPIVIDQVPGCSAAQIPAVTKNGNVITIRFSPATEQPPSYEVSRRLKSDPDQPAYYTVLPGTPTYNMGLLKWELNETWTSIELNKIWVYKVTSLCGNGARPYATVDYISQTCPLINLNSTSTSISYSFPHVGGQTNQYRVALYQGTTLIVSPQLKAVSPSPITGSFTHILPGTSYRVVVYNEITGTSYSQECYADISTAPGVGQFRVTQTAIPNVDEGLVTAVVGMPLVGPFTVIGYMEEYNGSHYMYEGVFGMTVVGSGWNLGATMRLYVNGGVTEEVNIYGPGTYNFAYRNYSSTDSIWVEFLAFT